MKLPAHQDIVTDMLDWKGGPLPVAELEHIAFLLFGFRYPQRLFDDPLFSAERDDARRLALQLRVKFRQMDRWTLSNMQDQLEAGFTRIVCGDRGPSAAEGLTLRSYAFSCLHGLFARFSSDRTPMVLPDSETHTWAIPQGHGISEQWQQAYVATKVAEVLTGLACPGTPFRGLDVEDRSWLRQHVEAMVTAVVARFQEGDRK